MEQPVDLKVLHHILKQYNEDVLGDCSRIICKFLHSVDPTAKLECYETFKSIKVLLNLCGELCTKGNKIESKLPTSLLLEKVKEMLCKGIGDCDHSYEDVQLELFGILHGWFKVLSLENPSEALEGFMKLQDCNMNGISAAMMGREWRSDCLMFNLKMVCTIYDLLGEMFCEADLYKCCRSDDSNYFEILAKLVLHGDDSVAVQTLTVVIPGYIKCFKSDAILEAIWKKTSESLIQSNVEHSRVMLILCSFFDTFFSRFNSPKKSNLKMLLFQDGNYWRVLQSLLVKNDLMERKQGMYLLRKTIEVLTGTEETLICQEENLIFYWDVNCEENLCKVYKNIIMILEFLDEQQIHIIKPILQMTEDILKLFILISDKVSPLWVLLLHHRALLHESMQVVSWGLSNLLNLPESFFEREDITRETIGLLVPVLNSPVIYYDNDLTVSRQLEAFLKKIAETSISRLFFSLFARKVCSLVWSPESLFFVTLALSRLPKCPFWGEKEIHQIRIFVKSALKTYHKIIRVGIQCNLLTAALTLMDGKSISLKNFILLISSFPLMDSIERDSLIWKGIIHALKGSYSEQEAQGVLQSYGRGELEQEFNEKSASLMFILLYYTHQEVGLSSLVVSRLTETLLLFKDIDKRLYCNWALYDRHLSVISQIHSLNANGAIADILRPTCPFLKGVMSYIQSGLKRISGLGEFETCQLYFNAFENISISQRFFPSEPVVDVRGLYEDVSKDLGMCLRPESSISSVGLYCRVKFMSLLLTLHPCETDLTFLVSYLTSSVNKALEKDESSREKTRDVQTSWGRMNSEFVEAKWKIFNYLVDCKATGRGDWISYDDLVETCVEGLGTGGYGVLRPIMSVLKSALPTMDNCARVGEIARSLWELLMERKKAEEFKSLVKGFVEMLFQEAFVAKGGEAEEILIWYADLIFANASLAVITVFMRHIQQTELAARSGSLFCHVIGKALTFGTVERKDERLTTRVCVHIEKLKICPVWERGVQKVENEDRKELEEHHDSETSSVDEEPEETKESVRVRQRRSYHWSAKLSDHYTNSEVRARAVERISILEKNSPRDRALAKDLIRSLMKLSEEANQKRERYFGNSHVHRVKHRVMQALLLLEPLLGKDERTKLTDWLYHGLLNENLQPSVRSLQEWLLIRLLVQDEGSRGRFFGHLEISKTIKKTGLCSLMAVGFHVGLLRSPELTEEYVDSYIGIIFKYLFHQNFDVRLHAQVVICKLFEIAELKQLENVKRRWGNVVSILSQVSSHMRDQSLRNYLKLQSDFFFNAFDAVKHYSLQVIYKDMPMLTNVGPDEWISRKMFRYCGVDPSEVRIPLRNTHSSLKHVAVWEKREGRSFEPEFEDEKPETPENYQRKVIPALQAPTTGYHTKGDGLPAERKDGLVVVASLIDRIPNLGGLARTCEIFGASEFVVSSLKCMEDKQFTSLSVTAEKWINIKEVKPENLKLYLLFMKRNGYVVVGAEQTIRSQSLSSVKFPKKTLLMLGNEKEGIPPNLLPFLDVCVEIPQMGIIRSLNVHVSGALFIWEYAKQIYFS